jgi:hypothetical protein
MDVFREMHEGVRRLGREKVMVSGRYEYLRLQGGENAHQRFSCVSQYEKTVQQIARQKRTSCTFSSRAHIRDLFKKGALFAPGAARPFHRAARSKGESI